MKSLTALAAGLVHSSLSLPCSLDGAVCFSCPPAILAEASAPSPSYSAGCRVGPDAAGRQFLNLPAVPAASCLPSASGTPPRACAPWPSRRTPCPDNGGGRSRRRNTPRRGGPCAGRIPPIIKSFSACCWVIPRSWSWRKWLLGPASSGYLACAMYTILRASAALRPS